MKYLLLTLLHLTVMTATLCGPGGVRAVIAENLLLKQQLIVLRRPRQRTPRLTASDPAAVRSGGTLPQPRTNPKGRHRRTPFDAPGVSSGVGASQVPPTVLVELVPEETQTEGPSEALIQALLHEYPLPVGRRGSHFSGPSAGATLRE